jgi:hypothetical protein
MTQEAGSGPGGMLQGVLGSAGWGSTAVVGRARTPAPAALPIEALVGRPDPQELGPIPLELGLGGRPGPVGSDLGAELDPGQGMGAQVEGPGVGPFAARGDVAQDDPLPILEVEDRGGVLFAVRRPMVVSSTMGPWRWPGVTSRPPVRRYSRRSRGETRCLMVHTPTGVPPYQLSSRDVAPIPPPPRLVVSPSLLQLAPTSAVPRGPNDLAVTGALTRPRACRPAVKLKLLAGPR